MTARYRPDDAEPGDEVGRVLQNIGRLMPQELAGEGRIAAAMERAIRERGC